MINLLTGKKIDLSHPRLERDSAVDEPWSSEAYLSAMRRLLNEAGRYGSPG